MPKEIFDLNEFLNLAGSALECRVKRLKDIVKLKLRTSGKLYTIRLDPAKAEDALKQIRCEIIEV